MTIESLPRRYQDKSLSNFECGNQDDKVQRAIYAIYSDRSLFLSGRPGTGKTHLAVALANSKIQSDSEQLSARDDSNFAIHRRYLFLPAVELFLDLKASFASNDITEDEILSRYTGLKLLILDDIGAEKVSDWSRQVFYTLIDRLYRYEKQVIITSNLSLDQLAQHIDDRIASRIVEMAEIITLESTDYRLKMIKGRK
jgi:DNA replication protein DnaC